MAESAQNGVEKLPGKASGMTVSWLASWASLLALDFFFFFLLLPPSKPSSSICK